MKKSLTIVLIILIGIFIYINRPRRKIIDPPDPNLSAIITLEVANLPDLEYSDVERIMRPLIELGYTHIEINEFQWIYHCTGCCPPPEYKNSDPIKLERHEVEFDRKKGMPSASEQYDINTIRKWCMKHSGKHADVQFGDDVKFNVIEAVTQLFLEYDISSYLKCSNDEDDSTDITIGLYQRPIFTKPVTILDETEVINIAIPQINNDFPGTPTNEYKYVAVYEEGVWMVYPILWEGLPTAEISDTNGVIIRTSLKE